MNHSISTDPVPSGAARPVSSSDVARDAIRYWESHRIAYNAVLTAVVLGWLAFTWPHFQPAFKWRYGFLLLGLAAAANACYCAAYPIDLLLQCSSFQVAWIRRRWILWCSGVIFAAAMAYYWIADELYPYVG